MNIPAEVVQQGIDWPAWFQAIGSVAAIGVAVWIDQGAARRAREQLNRQSQDRLTEAAERVGEWRRALADGIDALRNAASATPRISDFAVHPDNVDKVALARIVGNAGGMIDLYLASEPPNPHLAWALVAIRTELRLAGEVIARWDRNDVTASMSLVVGLDSHVATAEAALAVYHGEAVL